MEKKREKSPQGKSMGADIWEAVDHPFVLPFIFHPRKDMSPQPRNPKILERFFRVEEDVSIGSRLYVSNPEDPVIVFFHGNGEIASDYDELSTLYTQRAINLFVMDYRGYGKSTGQPTLSSMMSDAAVLFKSASGELRNEGFTGDLWVMGRSLGSASAIEIARQSGAELKGLIVESGFSDTLGLLRRIGVSLLKAEECDPWVRYNESSIKEVAVPTLIIHGQRDQIIPVSDGKALYAASGAEKKEILTIPRAGHNDLLWVGMNEYMDAIVRFVKESG